MADFKIAEASYYFEKMFADNVPHLEVLIRIRKNLEVLPEIVQYYKSEHAVHKPFLPEYAKLTF